jgi:hypothetical protein
MALNSFFSPNGFSVGNLFNPTNVLLANGDITAGNSVTANYFLGNGAFLSGIPVGNTTVSNTAPVSAQQGDVWIQANTGIQYIYFTSGGNSQWAEMEAAISISNSTGGNYGDSNVATFLAGDAGNIIPAANVTYSLGNSTRQWANLWVSGNTIYIGGVSLGVTNGQLTVGGNSVVTEGTSLTGNISTAGNVTGGNVIANYIYGDISNTSGGNSAVLTLLSSNTAFNITTTGAIAANTVQAQYLYGNGTFITGLPATFGNANLVAYGEAGWSGNIIPGANGLYNIGSNSNRWNDVYINSTLYLPFQTLTSNSTRIISSSSISAYDFISTNDIIAAANITATGNVSGSYVLGNIRFSTGGYNDANVAAYTGALTNLTGNVTTTANVSGSYILGNGAFLTGIAGGGSTYGDANVATYLASNAALTINTTANISTSANVSASNFIGTSPSTVIKTGNFTWTFGSTGTLTIPGNVNANSYYINNLTNPVQDQDAATKIYVDNLVSTAISYHEAVAAATTTTLAATTGGTITYNQVNGVGNGMGATLTTTGSFNLIDTANVQTANTRILVKNEANGAHNGVYVWSNATAITRASTENTAGVGNVDALGINDYFYVTGGNVNKGSAFIVDAPNTAIVFGTSNIQFAVFSQSQVYSANTAAGISLATTTISAKVDNITTAFDGGGNISVKAGANLVTPNIGAATGTSLNVTGNITSSGNISGTYILGNGAFLTGVAASGGGSYGNSNVADYLASNSNVPIATLGNITTTANITANNFIGAAGSDPNVGLIAGSYTWNFDNTGNLTIPGNIVGNGSNTTIQTGANRWNFSSDGQLYLPGNIVAGYRDIPQISWTGTPTIAASDAGKHYFTNSGGVSITLPANIDVLPIGAAITLINQSSSNCTIIVPGGAQMFLAGNATSANRTLSHFGFCTVIKTNLESYFVSGANVI